MLGEKLKGMLGTWTCLHPFFESEAWPKIKEALKPDMGNITPDIELWFRAFRECSWEDVKVVWLGLSPYYSQDPYTKADVADGLAFSTAQRHSVPPSLFKLYKGMEWDMWDGMNLDMMRSNELSFLANQGILMINSALTTTYGKADSHIEIWKPFIEYVMTKLICEKQDLVVTGFGKVAQGYTKICKKNQNVLDVEHPAAASYQSRNWEHQNLFTNTNNILKKLGKEPILWDTYLIKEHATV